MQVIGTLARYAAFVTDDADTRKVTLVTYNFLWKVFFLSLRPHMNPDHSYKFLLYSLPCSDNMIRLRVFTYKLNSPNSLMLAFCGLFKRKFKTLVGWMACRTIWWKLLRTINLCPKFSLHLKDKEYSESWTITC